jgi:hypothetical protein
MELPTTAVMDRGAGKNHVYTNPRRSNQHCGQVLAKRSHATQNCRNLYSLFIVLIRHNQLEIFRPI